MLAGAPVLTGEISLSTEGVWTTGLSTCIFVCIRSGRGPFVGWHFAASNAEGERMDRVRGILRTLVGTERAYLVPAVVQDDAVSSRHRSAVVARLPARRS